MCVADASSSSKGTTIHLSSRLLCVVTAQAGANLAHPVQVLFLRRFLFAKRAPSPSLWCVRGACTVSFPPNRSWLRTWEADRFVPRFDRRKPRIDPDRFPFVSDRLERRSGTRNEREAFRFDLGFRTEIPFSNRRCDGNRCRHVSTDVEDGRWEEGVSKPRASGWARESVTSKATRTSADRTVARTFDVGSVGVSSPGGVSSLLSDIDDPRSC